MAEPAALIQEPNIVEPLTGAILTHPNIVLVTEEVALRKQSAAAITNMIADCIEKRARMGKEYGIVLIPDGVVAAIPEVGHRSFFKKIVSK